MLWVSVLIGGTVLTAVVLAGRAHSRHLDRIQAKPQLMILPFAADEPRISGTATAAGSALAQVPIVVFAGERILVCSIPANQAKDIFETRDDTRHVPEPAKASEVLSDAVYPLRKPKVRNALGVFAAQKAS